VKVLGTECPEFVAGYFDWSQNCMVKITRPQAGWLGKLFKGAAPALNREDVAAIFARVTANAASLNEWEQVLLMCR